MRLVIISGLSGSGKSIALNVLEDSGYFVVDNLPAKLLMALVDYLEASGYERAAISVDVRSGQGLGDLPGLVREIQARSMDCKVLYLEAKTDTLVKRFSETRRRHPLSDSLSTLTECIERERGMLEPLKAVAHRIDTSDLSANALRAWVKEFVSANTHSGITLLIESFGFKHGIPLDADYVFDVRCLPNPHYDERLRLLTGRDTAVINFLRESEVVDAMLEDIQSFVARWLPCFERDNRSYLTIAIGCTGGRHRSVYIAESLANTFRGDHTVLLRHRELSSAELLPLK
ncbi:MAG: RNase adapter RapZ [Betaproteobacteria bacterium]|nr:RNase adapter RapZ [Betaproteobacteria bacterium]